MSKTEGIRAGARTMDRLGPSLTLLLWGGMLVGFYASGRLGHLLHPNFHGLVLVTGVLLLISAVCVLLSPEETAQPTGRDCGCAPGRRRGRWFMAFILLIPLPLAAWISPDQYSQTLVLNRLSAGATVATLAPTAAPETPAPEIGEPRKVEIGDLLIAAQTPEGRAAYEGQPVEFIGQVTLLGKDQTEFVRLLMLCCAADAQVLSVRINGPCPIPAMQWGKVRGTVHFIARGDAQIPTVTAQTITQEPPPTDPYVYHGGTAPPPRHTGGIRLPLPPH
ncbi:MAG: TIGR03943 family putative permease subunit [Chthoniobacteraceae bacterium]